MNEVRVLPFVNLFRGRADVLGHPPAFDGPISERRPVTFDDYAAHLEGRGAGIGVYPMLDSNKVWFAAIDLDEPNFDLALLMQRLIPGESYIESSKSGNAHVWVFFQDPCPAWAVRTILRGATQGVGRPEVEIFPKQDQLAEGMIGNFINLPYHGNSRPIMALDENIGGLMPVPMRLFLADANANRQDPAAWVRRARTLGGQPPAERTHVSEFGTQPRLHMCAQHILDNAKTNPVTPGHRAVVLFNVARQLLNWRDSTEEEVRRWVHELNEAGTKPAPRGDVDRQIDNAIRRRFTSTGCDDPVMQPYVHPDCPIANGKAGR